MSLSDDIAIVLSRMPSHTDGEYSETFIHIYIYRERGHFMEGFTIKLMRERFEDWRIRI